jgi:hypothetical protein
MATTSAGNVRGLIDLPPVDGFVEAGIAAGVDPTLPQGDKLPINGDSLQRILHNALGWAEGKNIPNAENKFLFYTGIAAIIGCGMLRKRNGIPDGDWYETSTNYIISDSTFDMLQLTMDKDAISRAATIVCATKVNYWLMNHHVGQTGEPNTAQGYIQKVLINKFGNNFPPGLVHVVHMLGQYASTRFVLQKAGIPNILDTEAIAFLGSNEIQMTDDAKLRFNAPPAGTQKMAVCYEAAKRLAKFAYAKFCPNIEEFSVLPEIRHKVMSNPATYHVSAEYLCGEKVSDYDDNFCDGFIGRLGVYIHAMAPRSTLARSPHFAESRVEGSADYDSAWRQTLQQIQRNREIVSSTQLTVTDLTEEASAAVERLGQAFLAVRSVTTNTTTDSTN